MKVMIPAPLSSTGKNETVEVGGRSVDEVLKSSLYLTHQGMRCPPPVRDSDLLSFATSGAGSDLSKEEMLRYGRHLIMPEIGIEGQKKLKSSRVLMIGAGGLGSPLGLYLAAAGVGTIGIVD